MRTIRILHKWIGLVIGLFIFISCFTGAFILIGKLTSSYSPIFKWMKTLHCTLFLDETGSIIIGIATLLLILEVITGYILWWKFAKGLMKSAHKKGASKWRGFSQSLNWQYPNKLWGLHVSGGFWAGLPLLLMALTGLTWSFGWYSSLIYTLFDVDNTGNLFHTIASIHTGSFWRTWSRILWLIFAILGTSLPITGVILFLKNHTKRNK